MKDYFTHTKFPKNTEWPYFGRKTGIYRCAQNIVSREKFCIVMWSICGAFYQKLIDQANRRLFYPYCVSKRYKMALFWPENWDIWM